MADPTGFLKVRRKEAGNRPIHERICDFSEVEQVLNSDDRMLQASRCMDCGTPFCHWACPLDNLIPEWNDLLWRGEWKSAYNRLNATNNFPEFTGRICPAPCEHACVLNINDEPVTIRENEVAISERAFTEGYIKPKPPRKRTDKRVAVIGSGPAGLAAADLLNKWGHNVTIFEKNNKAGGLLRYGIPDFKLSKVTIDRRLNLMTFEGVEIRTGTEIGKDIPGRVLLSSYDALCLAIGAMKPRDLNIEGRDLNGIYFAMDFLTQQNRINDGEIIPAQERISAEGLNVIVLGGGDTGSDCVGTAIRQKAKSVTQIEIMPMPPLKRSPNNPWPYYAKILKTSTSHEEGCVRMWSLSTNRFIGENGYLTGIEVEDVVWESSGGQHIMKPLPETRRIIPADMVVLALGFMHPALEGLIEELGLELDDRKNIKTDRNLHTSVRGVFAAGDAVSGASLVVNAIASGRKAAMAIDRYLRKEF
ncbi:MAG TPA: glutamate synthase subunit beta [Bacteroidales bacterium]|nr:glutamate synthase subunit beta [Bacteroidales bacterium]HOK74369.1 glutamate synthase subunit beta [Bacteroidales bacterium]HOM41055.1 glutamate synthase subunit beta [Bacteroidales bacterium]HPP92095.1 glutamate synthase subunit beta [Bacteroidales bacterium]HRR15580.1 glutamate synthase subunit beta [Bacteroidales bacterium]